MPPVEPRNLAYQVMASCRSWLVQFCTTAVADDVPPGLTAGGLKVIEVICTVPVQVAAVASVAINDPTTSTPAATARDSVAAANLRMATPQRTVTATGPRDVEAPGDRWRSPA